MKLHLPLFLRKSLLSCIALVAGCTLSSVSLAFADDPVLGAGDELSIDYAAADSIPNLENGSLQLTVDTLLQLLNCGSGDGKTYTLATGISCLLDAEGNAITLDSSNNAISNYFDTTQPGTGFWADGTLVLNDGTLQLVRHNETVLEAVTITTRQTGDVDYQYYEGVILADIIYTSSSSSACGGAIYGGDITLSNNGSVVFEGNKASSPDFSAYGGAIYGVGDITLSNNGSVIFEGNTAILTDSSAYGGAIYGYDITLSNNGSVVFEGNTAIPSHSSACGGAIYGHDITLSNNGSVVFEGNTASSTDSSAYGGAIYGFLFSTITLSNNGSVTFSGNTASGSSSACGGAIYGDDITLSNNGSVVFEGNTASSSSFAEGGAIYSDNGTISLSLNNSVSFNGNSAGLAGGALSGTYDVSLNGNGSVSFIGNSVTGHTQSYGADVYAYGGAIYVPNGPFSLCDNGRVEFIGNKASVSSSYLIYVYGGAICTFNDLNIRNNDSVEFYQNSEGRNGEYRLNSIVVGGYWSTVSLSAAEGKHITFRDSIYIDAGNTFNLNADYTDANGKNIKQQGDIIFTGATTEDDLYTVKGNIAGTASEVLKSRTSEIYTLTNLYGGRLRVEDGAIYQGQGITVHEGSAATVRVQNAMLSHSGYDLTFNAGTTLELAGNNIISGNLQMLEGSTLRFIYAADTTLDLTGSLNLHDSVTMQLSGYGQGSHKLLTMDEATLSGWEAVSFINESGNALDRSRFSWENNVLYFFNSVENLVWTNASGDGLWNNESQNWSVDGTPYAISVLRNVTFAAGGNGTITMVGNQLVELFTVQQGGQFVLNGNAPGTTLTVRGDVLLEENSALTLHGNLEANAVNGEGALEVTGALNVSGGVTAASLQAESLSAGSLKLTDATATNALDSSVLLSGAVNVAGALNIDGSMTAASLQAGALRAESLTLTDAAACSRIGSSVAMTGAANVAGTLEVEGSLSVASLQAGSVKTSAELQLTGINGSNIVHGDMSAASVSLASGASLEVGGALSTAEVIFGDSAYALSVGSLGSDCMNFELNCAALESLGIDYGESAAILSSENNLDSGFTATLNGGTDPVQAAVYMYSISTSDKAVMLSVEYVYTGMQVWYRGSWVEDSLVPDIYYIAGFDTFDGVELVDLKGQSVTGSELYVASEEMESVSRVLNGNLTFDYVDIADRQLELSAGTSLTTVELSGKGEKLVVEEDAVLNTPALTIGSLSLDGAAILNKATMDALSSTGGNLTIESGGVVTVKSAVDSGLAIDGEAGTLNVSGGLTAASLKIKSLTATALTLTDETAANSIGSDLTLSGAATVAGSLTVDGDLSAGEVRIGGSLNADAVETSSLTAGSVLLGSLTATSLNLTDVSSANNIGSGLALNGAATVAGSLAVNGALAADSVSTGGLLSAASLQTNSLSARSLTLTDSAAVNRVNGDVSIAGAANVAGALEVTGALSAMSLQSGGLFAESLNLTDAYATSRIGSDVAMSGSVVVRGALDITGSLAADSVSVGQYLRAASLQTNALETSSLELTDADAISAVGRSVSLSRMANVAGMLEINGSLSAASLQVGDLKAESLNLTNELATSCIGSSVTMTGAATVAGSLEVSGALAASEVNVGKHISAASLQTNALQSSSLELTDATAHSMVSSSVAVMGGMNVAGRLEVAGSLSAASLQAGGVKATSLTLTDAAAANSIGSSVVFADSVCVAGGLEVAGSLRAASLKAGALVTREELLLTGSNGANVVLDDMSAASVGLASGATLEVGGTLTAAEVIFGGAATTLKVGSLGGDSMNFVLDADALRNLNLSYNETFEIVKSSNILSDSFTATLNGDANSVIVGVYNYSVSVNGDGVQVVAGSAFDGKMLWYHGAWMGDSTWSDYYIAGYDAVDGVETVDLNAATVKADILYVTGEDGARTQLLNGTLDFATLELHGSSLELGSGTTADIAVVNAAGETLAVQSGVVLTVGEKMTVDVLALDGKANLKNAEICTITGTKGSLSIAADGVVTMGSDAVLTSFSNDGSLNLGDHALTVAAALSKGGNVTAGEVSVRNQGRNAASFDTLIADKVTVRNTMSASTFTDALSVGNGSAIGELIAETLEVRGGTVTLGRTSGSTEMSLQKLDLQEDATLVLNQQTSLEVTKELAATENATVQLQKNAAVSYDGVNISNRKESGTLSVDAYALSGEAELELDGAHVSGGAGVIDYKLVNSSVENTGGGTLTVTHEQNLLSGVHATGGDISLLNLAAATSLDVLEIAAGKTVNAYVGSNTDPATATQSNVTVSGTATMGSGAVLNASLTLAAGATLEMDAADAGAVTINGALTFGGKVALGEDLLVAVEGLTCWESGMVLFTGLTDLVLPVAASELESDRVLASSVFSNVENSSLYVTYHVVDNVGSLLVMNVPEPTTTTLSLLALTALAARRRRK